MTPRERLDALKRRLDKRLLSEFDMICKLVDIVEMILPPEPPQCPACGHLANSSRVIMKSTAVPCCMIDVCHCNDGAHAQ